MFVWGNEQKQVDGALRDGRCQTLGNGVAQVSVLKGERDTCGDGCGKTTGEGQS